jgi:hypothetical protein
MNTENKIDLRGIMESCCHTEKLFPTNAQFESLEKGFKEYAELYHKECSTPSPQDKEAVSQTDEQILKQIYPNLDAIAAMGFGLEFVYQAMSLARQAERSAMQKEQPTWIAEPNLLLKVINAIGHSDLNVLPKSGLDLDEETQSLAIEICKIFASERSIKGEAEMPSSLGQCVLVQQDRNELWSIWESYEDVDLAWEQIMNGAENKILDRVALLISDTGKELPTNEAIEQEIRNMFSDNLDPDSFSRTQHNAAIDIAQYFSEIISLLLLHEREKAKAFTVWCIVNGYRRVYGTDLFAIGRLNTNHTYDELFEIFSSDTKDMGGKEQICYSDNVTPCDCKGLCRNK